MATTSPSSKPRRRQGDFSQAMDNLQAFCAALQAGDLVPTHTELMRRFDVSECAVLKALDELQREGKLARQRGRRTFVTGRNGITELDHPIMPDVLVDTKTIVAILRPDHSFMRRPITARANRHFAIAGSGADVWANRDAFRFVY